MRTHCPFWLTAALLLAVLIQPLYAATSPDDVVPSIRLMLDRYSRKDVAGLVTLLADKDVLVMGSDRSEVCTNRAQAEELFRNDFLLWDSATFGALDRVFVQRSGNLVTAFFDVPFTTRRGGHEQTFIIRFATVWLKTSEGLKLLQSTNAVPTVGQSAKEIVAPKQ